MSRVPYVHLDVALVGARTGDEVVLAGGDDHHLRRVLRLRDAAEVEVADGHGHTATAVLVPGAIRLTADVTVTAAPVPAVTVAQALPKGRKFDEIVRQVTELGVGAIVPVASARSVTQLDAARATKAVERWDAVARAASQQARRPRRPEVSPVVDLEALVATLASARMLVADPTATTVLPDALGDEVGHLAVAIGPEGGWSASELEALGRAGGTPVGLGPTVLRTEHAAAAAVAVLAAVTGRWQMTPRDDAASTGPHGRS